LQLIITEFLALKQVLRHDRIMEWRRASSTFNLGSSSQL